MNRKLLFAIPALTLATACDPSWPYTPSKWGAIR